MSEPIAIQAPQPSSTGSSRIGTAGLAVGVAIVALVVAAAVVGNALVPQDPFIQDLGNRLKPPFWMDGSQAGHLFGTDQLGRDYLARLVYGARISLLIGIMTVITSGLIGITLGVLGGFFGGRVDDFVLFAITTRLSIPVVLVALAVVGLMGSSSDSSSRHWGSCCGIVLLSWRARPPCRFVTMTMSARPGAPVPRCRIS